LSSLLNGAMLTGSVMHNFQNLLLFSVSSLKDKKLIKKANLHENWSTKL